MPGLFCAVSREALTWKALKTKHPTDQTDLSDVGKPRRRLYYSFAPAAWAAAMACWAFICSIWASSTWRFRLVPVFFAYHSTRGAAMTMDE